MKNESSEMEADLKRLGLRRHGSVGKKMGSKVWGHVHYIGEIIPGSYIKTVLMIAVEEGIKPSIVRYDAVKDEVCLIECPDFDTSDEPVVGRSLSIPMSDEWKVTNPPKNPLIYHHKWMFVKDDYEGFDVEQSKKRSIWWKSQMGRDRYLSNRIGRMSFWKSWIEKLEQ